MIEEHVKETGSRRGTEILSRFEEELPNFKKITPNDYDRMMKAIARYEEKGMDREQAEIEAFYEGTGRGEGA